MENLSKENVKNMADAIGMTITDDELDKVIEALENETSPDEEMLKNVINSVHTAEKGELKESTVIVSSKDGSVNMTDGPKFDTELSASEINAEDHNKVELDYTAETKDRFADIGFNEEEARQLFEVVMRVNSGEKFSVYNALPEKAKEMINKSAANVTQSNDIRTRNLIATEFINYFISEMKIDQEFADLQTTIAKELEMPSIVDLYSDHINDVFNKLIEKADLIKDQYPDKAEKLYTIAEEFKKASSFSALKEYLQTSERARNRIRKDNKNIKRLCEDFNYKYEKSKFSITDIKLTIDILERKFADDENITKDDIESLVALICKYTKTMTPSKLEEHAFMYYTITAITSLDYIDIGNVNTSEYSRSVYNSIKDILVAIHEIATGTQRMEE